MLIILDDLHAADPTSLMMLVAVSRQIRAMRATIIGTYREVEVKHLPELAELITEAEREGLVLPLRGLGETDIGEFVERTWGVRAGSSLVHLLRDTTEGNPFFLHEVLRQMAADGQLAGGEPGKPASLNIPRGVSEFIKRLTQPLPEEARKTLDVASVLGREFSLSALVAATGKAPEALIDVLDRAAALELIGETRGPGRYSFRHALIREALYDALPAARRRALHRAAAEAIRAQNAKSPPFAEIAFHYCRSASPADAELAAEYSREAARAAERQLAYEEAAHHLRNAIDALALKPGGDDSLKAELMCELGEAQARTGDFAEARKTCLEAIELARRANRPEPFARAAVTAGRGVSNSGETDPELVLLLNEALDRLGDKDSPLRGQALARLGIELYWTDRERSVALCQEAVEMARRLDDPHTLIVALWGRHLSLRNPDSLEQRLADGREAIAVAERARERDFALEARFYRVTDLVEAGDIAGADLGLREYLVAEAELKDRFKRGLLLQGDARAHGRAPRRGGVARPAGLHRRSAERSPADPQRVSRPAWQRHVGARALGRTRAAAASLRRAKSADRIWPLWAAVDTRSARASRRGANGIREPGPKRVRSSAARLELACVDVRAGRHLRRSRRSQARGGRSTGCSKPYSARNAMLGWYHTYGSVAFALGRLAALIGRFDEAKAHFETALAANGRIRATVALAHTECELAKLLLTRARGRRRRAGERAHRLGAPEGGGAEFGSRQAEARPPGRRSPRARRARAGRGDSGWPGRERSEGRGPFAGRGADRAGGRRARRSRRVSAVAQPRDAGACFPRRHGHDHVLRHRRIDGALRQARRPARERTDQDPQRDLSPRGRGAPGA